MTIGEALREGKALLAASGIEAPALDSSLLLGNILGESREGLVLTADQPISPEAYRLFKKALNRRGGGECTAYILGRREFWGLEFLVSPAVLVPRPDTETLVETALSFIKEMQNKRPSLPLRILDLCTGSGAAAAALKHEYPGLEIWASDISAEALETAARNGERLFGNSGTEAASPIHFIQSDLFANIGFEGIAEVFDLITANPPYIPSGQIDTLAPEVRGEPRIALDGGADGLDLIRRICARAKNHLRLGGALFMEADPGQMRVIADLLQAAGFSGIETRLDLSGQERVIGCRA